MSTAETTGKRSRCGEGEILPLAVASNCADSAELQGSDTVTITLKIQYSRQTLSFFTILI
jgi:hypothetical protein